MASNQDPAVPYWVAQLNSPPAAKSKVNGIIDPPGFSGAPNGPKVRQSRHYCWNKKTCIEANTKLSI